MDAAARLNTWMDNKGLTRDEAGRMLGCHGSLLSKLVKRRQRPGRMVSLLIEQVVGIPQSDWDSVKVVRPVAPETNKRARRSRKSKRSAA